MPGGGEIAFKTADDPDKLRGQGLDLLILDEADFVPRRVWEEVLRPALADRKGRAVLISTPNREGGWLHELALAGAARDGLELASWSFPSWTNPYLEDGEIAAARASLPSIVFRREFGAEFVSASGALIQRAWLRTGEPVELEALRISVGVDLAISTRQGADYTAAVAIAREPGGRVYILDAERTRATFDGVLSFIRGFVERQRAPVAVVAVEQVAYQASVIQELLRTTSLPVVGVRPDRDKVTRFLPLQARYEQGLILHAPGLSEDYTRELLGFPVGEHDDLVDAAVYAYRSLAGATIEMS
jgi:predicted phage terminase large subunit-like protein